MIETAALLLLLSVTAQREKLLHPQDGEHWRSFSYESSEWTRMAFHALLHYELLR